MEKTLIDYFLRLVQIDSESKDERDIALSLKADLEELGFSVVFDKANEKTGGTIGNLIASLPGKVDSKPLLLCAHLDTVTPGKGVKPVIEGDLIKSDGTTILGSDDKSGIAQIVWAIKEIIENDEPHPPVELLFTISEEIGLLGAKYCDYSLLKAKNCYTLDTHEIGAVMNGAPSQNNLLFIVHGKKAHAGVEPEKGLNAIRVAAEALSAIPLGRIDRETTCNIGVISGGTARNVVPDAVRIKGEVRSHNEEKLQEVTSQICDTMEKVVTSHRVNGYQAKVEVTVDKSYSAFLVPEEEMIVQIARKASQQLSLPDKVYRGGGGSDANIFNLHGIKTVVIGTGMDAVHTLEENISISALEKGMNWVKEILRLYTQAENNA
jgi:tripeptide aminopeptidase